MSNFSHLKLLTKADAADIFGVCTKTIDNYVREGLLPAPVAFASREYWHPTVFQSFLDQRFGLPGPQASPQLDAVGGAEAPNRAPPGGALASARVTRRRPEARHRPIGHVKHHALRVQVNATAFARSVRIIGGWLWSFDAPAGALAVGFGEPAFTAATRWPHRACCPAAQVSRHLQNVLKATCKGRIQAGRVRPLLGPSSSALSPMRRPAEHAAVQVHSRPPSTAMVWPVMNSERSLASQAASSPRSRLYASLPSGIRALIAPRTASVR